MSVDSCKSCQVEKTSPAIIHLHEIKTRKKVLLVGSKPSKMTLAWMVSIQKFRAAWVMECSVRSMNLCIWVFPKIGVGPQNGWFIMVPNPINMDDLG